MRRFSFRLRLIRGREPVPEAPLRPLPRASLQSSPLPQALTLLVLLPRALLPPVLLQPQLREPPEPQPARTRRPFRLWRPKGGRTQTRAHSRRAQVVSPASTAIQATAKAKPHATATRPALRRPTS